MRTRAFRVILTSAFMAALLAGCSGSGSQNTGNQWANIDNARSQVNWFGTYQGIFPCADCEGIATMLVLNTDMSYALRTRQLGKEDIDKTSNGTFSWLSDNSHVRLQSDAQGQSKVFRVGKGFIELTLPDGKPIPNAQPDDFILLKTDD